jgi:hypothetical protein
MRLDNNNGQEYQGFGDWLFNDGHMVWIISLFFAYAAYLLTTEEE